MIPRSSPSGALPPPVAGPGAPRPGRWFALLLLAASMALLVVAALATAGVGAPAGAPDTLEIADLELEPEPPQPEDEPDTDEAARDGVATTPSASGTAKLRFTEPVGLRSAGEPGSVFRPPIA